MRRSFGILAVIALSATVSLAQNGGYLLINNDNVNGNSADIDTISSTGALAPRNAIGQNFKCFFVADAVSSDIAAFQIPGLKKVPTNFTNRQLDGFYGIGLAVSPNGKFLYSALSGSGNLAVMSIAPDCSLTLVGTPINQPDTSMSIAITKDGRALVVSHVDLGGAQAYTLNATTGAMTTLGPQLSFNAAVSECANVGCYPSAEDVDDTGQFWVWGNATLSGPSILTAKLTPRGFTNAAVAVYTGQTTLQNVQTPWFSPAARAGNGNLYLGAMGFGTGYPAGIIVATFDAGTITYASSTVNSAAFYTGTVQTIGKTGTGSPIAQIWDDAEANNTVQSYTVNGATLTPASSLKTTSSGSFAFSMTAVGR